MLRLLALLSVIAIGAHAALDAHSAAQTKSTQTMKTTETPKILATSSRKLLMKTTEAPGSRPNRGSCDLQITGFKNSSYDQIFPYAMGTFEEDKDGNNLLYNLYNTPDVRLDHSGHWQLISWPYDVRGNKVLARCVSGCEGSSGVKRPAIPVFPENPVLDSPKISQWEVADGSGGWSAPQTVTIGCCAGQKLLCEDCTQASSHCGKQGPIGCALRSCCEYSYNYGCTCKSNVRTKCSANKPSWLRHFATKPTDLSIKESNNQASDNGSSGLPSAAFVVIGVGALMLGVVALVMQYKKNNNDVVELDQLQTTKHHSYEAVVVQDPGCTM